MDAPVSQKLISLLRTEGVLTPAQLMARLNVSQPTLFRAVRSASKQLVALGANRNRKIAALREMRNLGNQVPVFAISEKGTISQIGIIISIYPKSFVFLLHASLTKPQFYVGLPYFIDDIKPQGFLGRSFNHKNTDLKLPPRILDWNNNDILEAMACRGEDLVGNLLLGAESFEHYQAALQVEPKVIRISQRAKVYAQYAQAALDGHPGGASAGGEQPKFSAVVQRTDGVTQKVLVKFSPSGKTFAAQRWHDLLICESISLQVLHRYGIATAEGSIVQSEDRTYLETVRFDRVGIYGRKGLVSLSALENEWTGNSVNWSISAIQLQKEDKITLSDLHTIKKLECFGRLIANSDRHPGNLSFHWQPGDRYATLAPVYDMLPMLYAPSSGGEDLARVFTRPTYDHTLLSVWKEALSMATEYWERVSQDLRISEEFRKIADQNIRVLS